MIQLESDRKDDNNDSHAVILHEANLSQRAPNYLDLVLSSDKYTTDEPVKGHIQITLADHFEAKRITLSIVGELLSEEGPRSIHKPSMSVLKRFQTSIAQKRTHFQKTYTASAKDTAAQYRKNTRTLARTFTLMSKVAPEPMSLKKNQTVASDKSRELFCHYSIPLFTFKTTTLPPGSYRLPFKFTLSADMLPTAKYNNNDENFKFAVNYKIIAELEEDEGQRTDDDEDRELPPAGFLKSTREIKIYKVFKEQKALVGESTKTTLSELVVTGKLNIPRLLCCFDIESVKIVSKLQNTSFMIGEKVMYQLESHDKRLNPSKTKVQVYIVEELNAFGNRRDVKKTPLDNSEMLFVQDSNAEILNKGGSIITGEVSLPKSLEVTFRSPNVDIEHFLEIILSYSTGLFRQAISLRTPITLKKNQCEEKEQTNTGERNKESNREEEEKEEEEEDVMVLPMARFKLEEKFNILTKTADMLNDMYSL